MCIYQEITNAWINQSAKKPKSSRMFFENDKLYSYGYHYVIARIDRERNIVLINNNKSSPTTNRHKNIVENVIEHSASCIKVFNVPNPSTNLEYNLHRLRDNLQSAIAAANKHMIKPNMQAAETIANDFDALAVYMGATANIIYTTVYTDYLALKDRYNAKRNNK